MLQRVRSHPDFHLVARRASTLVAGVLAPDAAPPLGVEALLAACGEAGIAVLEAGAESPWAVLSVRGRGEAGPIVRGGRSEVVRRLERRIGRGGVSRVILMGGPGETLVLHAALGLLGVGVDVGVVWDASVFADAFARDLTVGRATQAGVIPYTAAALAAELELDIAVRPARAGALRKEIA